MNRKRTVTGRVVIRCEKSDTERPPEAQSRRGNAQFHWAWYSKLRKARGPFKFAFLRVSQGESSKSYHDLSPLIGHGHQNSIGIEEIGENWSRDSRPDWTWAFTWCNLPLSLCEILRKAELRTAPWLERTESGEKGGVERLISARHYMGESYTYVLREGWCLRGDHAVKLR